MDPQQHQHAALMSAHEAFLASFLKRKRGSSPNAPVNFIDAGGGFVISRRSSAFANVCIRQLERRPVDKASRLAQVVLRVFKRFCGCQDKLLIKGKLVNAEEIEIHAFTVLKNSTQPADATEETLEEGIDIHDCCRVIAQVQFQDDSAEIRKVGNIVVAQVYSVECQVSPALPMAKLLSQYEERKCYSRWAHLRPLDQFDKIFGFDIHWESSIHFANSRDEDCFVSKSLNADVNAMLMSDSTFRDVRGVAQMMQHYNLANCCSFFSHATDVNVGNDYLELAKRQKRQWSDERLHYARQLLKAGRAREALDEVTSSLKIDNSNVEALLCRGELFLDNHRYHEAVESFEQALEVDSTHEIASRHLRTARSKLAHSRHSEVVTGDGFLTTMQMSPEKGSRCFHAQAHRADRSEEELSKNERRNDAPSTVRQDEREAQLEKEKKLQNLLEESLKKRKRHRKDDKERKRKKKDQKKRTKKRDKHSRRERSSSSSRRHGRHSRRHSNRNSGASSSDSSDGYSSASESRGEQPSEREQPHPILSRQQHRLWK